MLRQLCEEYFTSVGFPFSKGLNFLPLKYIENNLDTCTCLTYFLIDTSKKLAKNMDVVYEFKSSHDFDLNFCDLDLKLNTINCKKKLAVSTEPKINSNESIFELVTLSK
ncbi:hypothetical protein BpHYR1_032322 [Brachionus plicatilis]|uniref:Uncharacterized protein n=1 Tax=Brachionus plicatilis TaxID=10195 RepID=A0A3M7T0T6_BRAPC|nr:hypothetical protein BpHYR1_032322 [Brachionus plicatilis]